MRTTSSSPAPHRKFSPTRFGRSWSGSLHNAAYDWHPRRRLGDGLLRRRAAKAGGGGRGEGLWRTHGEAAGEKLDADPVDRCVVNVGTAWALPYLPTSQVGSGKDRRHPMAPRRDGASVVVRGRESRLHGEGRQRVRSLATGMPGGRR